MGSFASRSCAEINISIPEAKEGENFSRVVSHSAQNGGKGSSQRKFFKQYGPFLRMPNIGDIFPNFRAMTTEGEIDFYDWLGNSWGILFSHPGDFTPVCTSELGKAAQLAPEFQKRGIKIIGLSCSSTREHEAWIPDILAYTGLKGPMPFPIISDEKRELAVGLGMLDPEFKDDKGMPMTCRALFIIGPDKKLKMSILYPALSGRNFSEILRVVDSLQLTDVKKVSTPVDWKYGEDCMVDVSVPRVYEDHLFPKGVTIKALPSGKDYFRTTPMP
ncbi:peroxiredoxin-6-like [Branchiostoma floridae]|uniref:Peroxiredoxin-6 n=2 Tax=Branchiostoma floridae TaxID=7739 RepID=A0A9J7MBT1_BRAFL|nr:peroxiredoxin-6-like [Branchiostoma floridae]